MLLDLKVFSEFRKDFRAGFRKNKTMKSYMQEIQKSTLATIFLLFLLNSFNIFRQTNPGMIQICLTHQSKVLIFYFDFT